MEEYNQKKDDMNINKTEKMTGIMCILLSVAILAAALLAFNTGGLVSRGAAHFFPEITFTVDTIQSALHIKDMEVTEDGAFVATTSDPWIYIRFAELNGCRPVVLNLVMEHYPEDSYMEVWTVENYQREKFTLKPGDNYLQLTRIADSDVGIRLDLFPHKGLTGKMNYLIVNDNAYLTGTICNMFRNLAVIGVCFLAYYLFKLLWMRLQKKDCTIVEWSASHRKLLEALCVLLAAVGILTGLWELSVVVIILCFAVLQEERETKTAAKILHICAIAGLGIIVAVFSTALQCDSLLLVRDIGDKCLLAMLLLLVWEAGRKDIGALLCACFYLLEHVWFMHLAGGDSVLYIVKYSLVNAVTALNVMIVLLIYMTITELLGRRLGNLINWFFTLLYFAACAVKLRYNGEMFRMADFKLMGELVGIIDSYVPIAVLVLAGVLIVVLIVMCVIWRKKLAAFFRPIFRWDGISVALVMVLVDILVLTGRLYSMGITVGTEQLDVNSEIVKYGFSIYTLTEFTGNNNMNKPEGYGEDIVEEIRAYKDTSTENDVRPTVILILGESLYDIESVPGLTFNEPVLANLSPYRVGNCISPSYGGRTAVAEFEALTGLSDMYFTNGAVEYENYLNSGKNGAGGLAREFNNNDYYTVAIHANREDFYSRGAVYENMGFDDFVSLEDMNITDADRLGDNYVKDYVLVDCIINEMENSGDEPAFIFGASIASHGLYDNKYTDTEIKASSDVYSADVIQEVNNYSQSVHDLDTQLGRLFEYCDGLDRPVNIYIFGDHLPSIRLNEKAGYLDDPYKKYCTPIYAYSNYTELSVDEEYISLAQLAPQILRDSGVSYSAYFDALYDLRDTYPVVHPAWEIDVTSPEIKRLYSIEYDLIFGRKYLLE